MSPEALDNRLSRISTAWTLLAQAHGGQAPAQLELMRRYHGAVYRYLLGAVRQEDQALELFQEFALRFLQGRLRHAHPERGRFRDYLKVTLSHLVTDFHRERRRTRPLPAGEPTAEPTVPEDPFLSSWRDELLTQAWATLARENPNYYCALSAQAAQPEQSAEALAGLLTTQFQKPASAASARVTLHRARQKFADLLVDEVRRTLQYPSAVELEQEIKALGLHGYCKPMATEPPASRGGE
jgi:RNA polymerase sigma-70 factor (ECF subfamily)